MREIGVVLPTTKTVVVPVITWLIDPLVFEGRFPESPPYWALIIWVPIERYVIGNVAVPFPRMEVVIGAPKSERVTVPEAWFEEATVAVKVKLAP